MVKAGLGIGIVPYLAIAREVRARQFFCSRIEGHQLVRETGWVYAKSSRVPRMIQELLTAFEQIKERVQLAPSGSRARVR
jgi:DNA-binding transcriptional LysR family regulator